MTGALAHSVWSESRQGAESASFADVLSLTRAVLPAALIDDRGGDRLMARAGGLPSSAADAMFGFECRLDDPEASADLLLSVPPDMPFADALVRDRACGVSGATYLARLLSELRQANSRFAATVDLVALEYDMTGVKDFPAPGIFLRSAADSGYADAGLLTSTIALATGWSETPTERNAVSRILAALPPGAAIRWAGAFPDRTPRAVRLLVRALGDAGAEFLTRIGWTGDTSAIDRIVSAFRACGVDNHVLALDIVEGRVSRRLGLEFSRPERIGGSWKEALDMMSRERWCLPGKADALGLATVSERIFSRAGVSELHCGVHHVKLAFSPSRERGGLPSGGPVAGAKGYVACVLRPLS